MLQHKTKIIRTNPQKLWVNKIDNFLAKAVKGEEPDLIFDTFNSVKSDLDGDETEGHTQPILRIINPSSSSVW